MRGRSFSSTSFPRTSFPFLNLEESFLAPARKLNGIGHGVR